MDVAYIPTMSLDATLRAVIYPDDILVECKLDAFNEIRAALGRKAAEVGFAPCALIPWEATAWDVAVANTGFNLRISGFRWAGTRSRNRFESGSFGFRASWEVADIRTWNSFFKLELKTQAQLVRDRVLDLFKRYNYVIDGQHRAFVCKDWFTWLSRKKTRETLHCVRSVLADGREHEDTGLELKAAFLRAANAVRIIFRGASTQTVVGTTCNEQTKAFALHTGVSPPLATDFQRSSNCEGFSYVHDRSKIGGNLPNRPVRRSSAGDRSSRTLAARNDQTRPRMEHAPRYRGHFIGAGRPPLRGHWARLGNQL